eukprot:GHVU01066931.1.p1 GENE.GHVU01066931.1~~GHVU01066931.1.p1  ORF type:complete len:828 (+),score=142.37 GHVU01066931.1:128-2611(+)
MTLLLVAIVVVVTTALQSLAAAAAPGLQQLIHHKRQPQGERRWSGTDGGRSSVNPLRLPPSFLKAGAVNVATRNLRVLHGGRSDAFGRQGVLERGGGSGHATTAGGVRSTGGGEGSWATPASRWTDDGSFLPFRRQSPLRQRMRASSNDAEATESFLQTRHCHHSDHSCRNSRRHGIGRKGGFASAAVALESVYRRGSRRSQLTNTHVAQEDDGGRRLTDEGEWVDPGGAGVGEGGGATRGRSALLGAAGDAADTPTGTPAAHSAVFDEGGGVQAAAEVGGLVGVSNGSDELSIGDAMGDEAEPTAAAATPPAAGLRGDYAQTTTTGLPRSVTLHADAAPDINSRSNGDPPVSADGPQIEAKSSSDDVGPRAERDPKPAPQSRPVDTGSEERQSHRRRQEDRNHHHPYHADHHHNGGSGGRPSSYRAPESRPNGPQPPRGYFDSVIRQSPSETTHLFFASSPRRVQVAAQATVGGLMGSMARFAVEPFFFATADKLAAVLFQLQMTGYMLHSADCRLGLEEAFVASGSRRRDALPPGGEDRRMPSRRLKEMRRDGAASGVDDAHDDDDDAGGNATADATAVATRRRRLYSLLRAPASGVLSLRAAEAATGARGEKAAPEMNEQTNLSSGTTAVDAVEYMQAVREAVEEYAEALTAAAEVERSGRVPQVDGGGAEGERDPGRGAPLRVQSSSPSPAAAAEASGDHGSGEELINYVKGLAEPHLRSLTENIDEDAVEAMRRVCVQYAHAHITYTPTSARSHARTHTRTRTRHDVAYIRATNVHFPPAHPYMCPLLRMCAHTQADTRRHSQTHADTRRHTQTLADIVSDE